MKIMSGNGNLPLTRAIALSRTAMTEAAVGAADEVFVEIHENVRGEDLHRPVDQLPDQ
jgi:ribose-phosphate pyrophosphokinase